MRPTDVPKRTLSLLEDRKDAMMKIISSGRSAIVRRVSTLSSNVDAIVAL